MILLSTKNAERMAGCYEWPLQRELKSASCGLRLSIVDKYFQVDPVLLSSGFCSDPQYDTMFLFSYLYTTERNRMICTGCFRCST